MNMATIRISEAEAIRDIAGLLARAYRGEEIVIEKDAASPVVVLRTVVERPMRLLSESLRLAKEHGSTATLDGGFARDLEAAVNSHPEPLENPWG
jgi:antitoxin (DNA-binding transcriptional repressor) of toxin-antitoxin stability system